MVVAGTTDSAEFQRAKAAAEVRLAKRCLPAPFMADCWAHPSTRTFGGESHGGLTTDAASPSSSLGRRHLSRLWNNLGIREPSGRQMGRIFACACVWVASKRVSTDIGWPCCHRLNNGSSTQHSSPKACQDLVRRVTFRCQGAHSGLIRRLATNSHLRVVCMEQVQHTTGTSDRRMAPGHSLPLRRVLLLASFSRSMQILTCS